MKPITVPKAILTGFFIDSIFAPIKEPKKEPKIMPSTGTIKKPIIIPIIVNKIVTFPPPFLST
jgi:hypothetical protein